MEKIRISSKKSAVLPQEAIDLWVKLNWGTRDDYNKKSVETALKNTSFIVSARNKKGDLVGLTRVLSDGVFHTTVADIVVDPDYQGGVVGDRMMEKVKKRFGKTGIYIEAFKANREFFEDCGYIRRDQMAVYSRKFE